MTTAQNQISFSPMLDRVKHIPHYLGQPLRLFQNYEWANLRPDLLSGLTIAFILLPQAVAFALIVELPPTAGLYAAIVGAIVAGLWGSSNQVHTGPTNAISLLVLSTLLTVATPGTPKFIMGASLMAVMVGVFQLIMGFARLGILVNFVSHSVIVGFSSGAGVLIALNQARHLLRLEFQSQNVFQTVQGITTNLLDTHYPTAALGFGTIFLVLIMHRINRKIPAALISMTLASIAVFVFNLGERGVNVIGELPASFPPVGQFLESVSLEFIGQLSTGALAIGAIGLVQTVAIARSMGAQTGQRLSSNQEFIGQGLANVASGFFAGYACAGSFTRSAVNLNNGAKSPMSSIFSAIFVLLALLLFTFVPLTVYLPKAALAGVLIVIASGMINKDEIMRIWHGARNDAWIMIATFLGTLLLPIEFAVLLGILLSFALYIMKTSVPRVVSVVPDRKFKHFIEQPDNIPPCPQLGIIEISGDLYFGAVSHVEQAIRKHMMNYPEQRFLLLRLHRVNQCDFSGIHFLESLLKTYRDIGGDVFFVRVSKPVLTLMETTGFYEHLGAGNILPEDDAISYIFHKIIDPAICIYECAARTFKECQNLPKKSYAFEIPLYEEMPQDIMRNISAKALWELLSGDTPPLVVDVREPREFKQGHVPAAHLIPLGKLLANQHQLNGADSIILVCRTGRRSLRAAHALHTQGQYSIHVLDGGMRAWDAAGLLQAVEF